MNGGMTTEQGFDNSFNMLLPLMLLSEDDRRKRRSTDGVDLDMLVLMMAMQSQAPGTTMGTNVMLPLLLMSDESADSNESLMFFMMMNNGPCEPIVY